MSRALDADDAIQTLIEQDGVTVDEAKSYDYLIKVDPEYTTGGPAMDPVEVWADHDGSEFVVDEIYDGHTTAYVATERTFR